MSSYQSQGKLIAILELIICACGLLGTVVAGIMFSSRRAELVKDEATLEKYPQLKEFMESSASEQAFYFIIPAVYLIGELALAVLLYMGASENKPGLLKTWTTLTIVMSGIGIIFVGFGIISAKDKVGPIVIAIFGYVFTGYSVWIGYSLCQETKITVVS